MAAAAAPFAQMAVSGLTGWLGGRAAAGATKRAGTTLADLAQEEEARANALPGRWNPFISQAYNEQMANILGGADYNAGGIDTAAQQGAAGARAAGREAGGYLDPYTQAGGRSVATLSDLVNAPEERFSGIDLTMDPSYQFRLSEGQKALQKSAAARGGLLGGGALKAISNYGQQSAAQEYQAAYARSLDTFKANQQARQDRMRTLSDLSQLGGRSAGMAGEFLTRGEQFAGELGLKGATAGSLMRQGAAEKAGQWGLESANKQMGINMGAEDIARQARQNRAQATAGSQMGVGNVWSNYWNQLGGAANDALSQWMLSQQGGAGGQVGGGDYQTDADAASAAIRKLYGY